MLAQSLRVYDESIMSTENRFSQMQGPSHVHALQMQGDTRRVDLVLLAYKMFFCLTTSLYGGDIFNYSVSFRFVSFRFWFLCFLVYKHPS